MWTVIFEAGGDAFDMISVPAEFSDLGYVEICRACVRSGLVPLGLYRPTGTFGSYLPYTHVNPRAGTRLVPGDQVFVLKGAVKKAFGGPRQSWFPNAKRLRSRSSSLEF